MKATALSNWQRRHPESIRAGDVLLFSGCGPLERAVQPRLGSPWNQASLVIRWPGHNALAILESTALSVTPSLEPKSDKPISGVQVVDFAEKLAAFEGLVAHRPLRPNLTEAQELALVGFAESVIGMPFNKGRFYMARAILRRNVSKRGDGFFCSELVAAAYESLGILNAKARSSCNYIPPDFAVEMENLELAPPYGFGDQWILGTGLHSAKDTKLK